MYPPKNARCASMPSSSHEVPIRLLIAGGYEYGTQSILDTGIGPTLVRNDTLPKGMKFTPIEKTYSHMLYDLIGG